MNNKHDYRKTWQLGRVKFSKLYFWKALLNYLASTTTKYLKSFELKPHEKLLKLSTVKCKLMLFNPLA